MMLSAINSISATIAWNYEHTSFVRADEQSPWIPTTQFNVYHSLIGDGDWTLLGTTSNQTFTVTNRGWYSVEAFIGTNASQRAQVAFNPPMIAKLKSLRAKRVIISR